jgi:hypothetical protein
MLLLRGAQCDVPFTLFLCRSGSARRRKSVQAWGHFALSARDVPCTESPLCSCDCAVLSEEMLYACSAHCKPDSCLRLFDCQHALLPCPPPPNPMSQICASAALMANKLEAAAIFVFTRRGYMAHFLSRCRYGVPCFACMQQVDRHDYMDRVQCCVILCFDALTWAYPCVHTAGLHGTLPPAP